MNHAVCTYSLTYCYAEKNKFCKYSVIMFLPNKAIISKPNTAGKEVEMFSELEDLDSMPPVR